ncbi:biofilm development regulator YmgB/AriR family protein [Pantoea sp. NPDC088449]|uniref:Biofilm development protein YmgB/AriR n=1 Tax=Candidatus Pantoea floridensis TaxID=1938870 RepID=A0A286DRJ4_9GAMM|nr:biofilm development regulator YmgB/AriR family protein [Pantoea floridensis]PIF07467.1 biofilm development protein YmgB/AriR [Enterobacteriaceae bacterium JKS000233]SOD61290.1 Biofilm development protein YmgB/AriR [Pantoea floridensis]
MKNTNSVSAIRARLQNLGETLTAERNELEAAIKAILALGGQLTKKTLIIHVISELEQEQDAQRQTVLRDVLELIVTHTPDDAGGQAL